MERTSFVPCKAFIIRCDGCWWSMVQCPRNSWVVVLVVVTVVSVLKEPQQSRSIIISSIRRRMFRTGGSRKEKQKGNLKCRRRRTRRSWFHTRHVLILLPLFIQNYTDPQRQYNKCAEHYANCHNPGTRIKVLGVLHDHSDKIWKNKRKETVRSFCLLLDYSYFTYPVPRTDSW